VPTKLPFPSLNTVQESVINNCLRKIAAWWYYHQQTMRVYTARYLTCWYFTQVSGGKKESHTVLCIFFRLSRNLKSFENVSATVQVTWFELNFIHSKSDTVSLICDHSVSWSNIDLQWQQAGKDHVYISPDYNDDLDIKQQHKI
jgi:hypothetical protein